MDEGKPAKAGVRVLEVEPPSSELIAAWDSLDDETIVTISKGELTHLMNSLSALIVATSEGQLANYWAVHHQTLKANESNVVYRTQIHESFRSNAEFAKSIMASMARNPK